MITGAGLRRSHRETAIHRDMRVPVYFREYGKLKEILKVKECTITRIVEESDAIIINTCTVVALTERRMLRRLSSIQDHPLSVTGCMPEVQQDAILASMLPDIYS